MAKIVLTFEDRGEGVKVDCRPSFAEIMQKLEGSLDVTNAEAYAMYALRMVREKSKENKGKGVIELPKPRRLM